MKRLGVSLLAFVLAVGLAEVGLRLAGYRPVRDAGGDPSLFHVLRPADDRDEAYELVPGAHGHFWESDVHVNSLGFRGDEVAATPAPGTNRILALGDSTTFGYGVGAEEAWPAVLERLLAQAPGAPPVEVLNLGIPGYDTLNEAARLAGRGLALDPDLALVGYCLNDASVATAKLTHALRIRRYASPWYRLRLLQFIGVQLDGRQLAREMERINEKGEFREYFTGRLTDVSGDAELKALVARLAAHLRERAGHREPLAGLDAYLRPPRLERLRYAFEWMGRSSEGVPTVVVPLPAPIEAKDPVGYGIVWEIVGHEARRAGLRWIDRERLPAAVGPLNPSAEIHFDAEAHRNVARALFDAWPEIARGG